MSPASQSSPDDGALAAAIAVRDETVAALQAALAEQQELNARAAFGLAQRSGSPREPEMAMADASAATWQIGQSTCPLNG